LFADYRGGGSLAGILEELQEEARHRYAKMVEEARKGAREQREVKVSKCPVYRQIELDDQAEADEKAVVWDQGEETDI